MKKDQNEPRLVAQHTDSRGTLSVIEGRADVPFAIKRVFFITNVPAGTQRGRHAYRHQEFLVCLQGKCTITIDDGSVQTRRTLDRPDAGLLIPANTWRTLDGFSPDCILAVLSDAHYSPADYCFDYVRFKTQLEF